MLYAELILTPDRRRRCRETFECARGLGLPIAATHDVHFGQPGDWEFYRTLRAIAAGSTLGRLEWDLANRDWGKDFDYEHEHDYDYEHKHEKKSGAGLPACRDYEHEHKHERENERENDGNFRARNRARNRSFDTPFLRNEIPLEAQESGEEIEPDPDSARPSRARGPLAGETQWLMPPERLREAWRGLADEIERSIAAIAEACRFDLPLGVWKFPQPHLEPGETPFSQLWRGAFAGLQSRMKPITREAIERLRSEIEVIDRLGFSAYFLAVHEIAEQARRMGMDVLGRGSAANALVSYALGFTGVDPLRHNLYFERFLNPERGTPPDIDLDFSWKDRDALLDWVFDRFGRERTALISTTVRLQARQAIREAGKAMGLAGPQISRVTHAIPFWFASKTPRLDALGEEFPECRGLPLREEPWASVLAAAQRILGFPTHYGIHCGGIVIAPDSILNYVPLVRAAKGFNVTQMDMRPIEELGLIKIDLLGNRSLGVYKDALAMIRANGQ